MKKSFDPQYEIIDTRNNGPLDIETALGKAQTGKEIHSLLTIGNAAKPSGALRRRWLRAASLAYERVRVARQTELDRVSAYLAHYSVPIEQLATKLQESNEVSLEEAQKLVEKYKQAYPGLQARDAQDVSRAEGVDAEIPVLSENAEKTEGEFL